MVGHNPGWEEAVETLAGHSERMTTCNAALFEGSGPTWQAAMASRWDLIEVLRPRKPRS